MGLCLESQEREKAGVRIPSVEPAVGMRRLRSCHSLYEGAAAALRENMTPPVIAAGSAALSWGWAESRAAFGRAGYWYWIARGRRVAQPQYLAAVRMLAALVTKELAPREATGLHYSSGAVLWSFVAFVAIRAHGRVNA
jgi:hypothetical protein